MLWQYYRDGPALTDAVAPDGFPGNSASFKYKQKVTGSTGNDGTKAVKIMVPLKYLSNFWRTLEVPLINCETNLMLNWSANCVISTAAVDQATIFAITDTKLYVPAVSLSTDDNGKLLQQLKPGFKRTGITVKSRINVYQKQRHWNKYLSKTKTHSRYFLPTSKAEDYNENWSRRRLRNWLLSRLQLFQKM